MKEFRALANDKIADQSSRFFKTQKGEYGYGDIFLGIRVPEIRKFAKIHKNLPLTQIKKLIRSKYHEERLLGLILVLNRYKVTKDNSEKIKLYELYIDHFKFINNWDLVDVTCPHIIGAHLLNSDRSVLYEWAKSNSLWIRRISIVSTLWFIRNNDLKDVFKLAKELLHDDHDLIHKAVGWVIREAGKKDFNKADRFIKRHCKIMPRTMLRYAIENYPDKSRKQILQCGRE
jgi:3-methyladenine DNA glycosylase AlkD